MPSARPGHVRCDPRCPQRPTAKPILCTVPGAAAARMRSFWSERCTMRAHDRGAMRDQIQGPSNSPQTTMPASDPDRHRYDESGDPDDDQSHTGADQTSFAAEIGALETIMVAALHASASPARIYPDIKGSMPNMVFQDQRSVGPESRSSPSTTRRSSKARH